MQSPLVVGLGVTTIDYIANVDSYPARDTKIRTTSLKVWVVVYSDIQIKAGGNVLNGLGAIVQRGMKARLVSSFGDDPLSFPVRQRCEELGVDTSFVVRGQTGFSYIIVDEGSRTIIHTPGNEMTETDMDEQCLDGASLLYIDGRHPEAALCAARWAVARNLPIIFDLERRRGSPEGFDELIRSATILSMSKDYVSSLDDEIMALWQLTRLSDSRIQMLVVTIGEFGSLAICPRRVTDQVRESIQVSSWEELIQLSEIKVSKEEWNDQAIRYFSYQDEKEFEIIHTRAFPYAKEEILDTTGAGDVFVGTLCATFLEQRSVEDLLKEASVQAGLKCTVK